MNLARSLWSDGSRSAPLWGFSVLVLGVMLGTPDLMGDEARWGVICREMIRSGDYLHPYLFDEEYYDKPLLSYWLMVGFAKALGGLNEWTLRLPGALAGLLAIWSTTRIGLRLLGRGVGLMAGWMLASCFVFVFWARLAKADIFNIAAIAAGAAWYFERREKPGWVTYSLFFLILALGAHLKGLIAPVLTILVLLSDLLAGGRWKGHVRSASFYGSALLGAALYLSPYYFSSPNGLVAAIRESVVRYLKPFDHTDPPYVYWYLVLYALPWTILLPWVLWRAGRGWRSMSPASRWPLLASLVILVFLLLSGSRRNYYILPILPFIFLAVADWVGSRGEGSPWSSGSARIAAASGVALLALYGIGMPLVEAKGGVRQMAREIRVEAERRAPWSRWQVLLVSSSPSLGFYLNSAERPHRINAGDDQTLAQFVRQHPQTVVVTKAKWSGRIAPLLPASTRLAERLRWPMGRPRTDGEANVAFVLGP